MHRTDASAAGTALPPSPGLTFLAAVPPTEPTDVLLVGGLPRSGTSSCDRFLHAFTRCFMLDEHHGLIQESFLSAQEFLLQYRRDELAVWTDAAGRSWRDYDGAQLDWLRQRSLLALLFLCTRPGKFAGKEAAQLGVVGFKLPHLERTVARVARLLAPLSVHFVYCVREPLQVLQSNWQMPWVGGADTAAFGNGIAQQYGVSLAAYRAARDAGIRTVVWRTPERPTSDMREADAFLAELGLAAQLGPRAVDAVPVIDEWPAERRRTAVPLPEEVLIRFSQSAEVQAFRREFGLAEPDRPAA
ncbi:MAG: sulfotransferase [Rhodoferax sp.]|nr:sulfotransferase [Rhodoferax sp.]